MLKILYVPRVHTTPNLTGCSNFNAARWALEGMGRRGLAKTTIWLPQGVSVDGLGYGPGSPTNITVERGSRSWKPVRKEDAIETDDLLLEKLRAGKSGVDVVMSCYHFTPAYHSILQSETSFGPNIPAAPPVIGWFNEFPEQEGLATLHHPAAVAMVGLIKVCGDLWFISDYAREEFCRNTSLLAPSIRSALLSSPVMLPSLDTDETDFDALYAKNLARQAENNGRPLCVMNAGSVSPRRRFDDLVDAVGKANSAGGPPTSIRFFTQLDKVPDSMKKSWVKTETSKPRKELIAELWNADLVYDGNTREGTGLYLQEAICAGALPVLFTKGAKPWMRGRMPADYPFVASNEHDLTTMFRWLAKNMDSEAVVSARAKIRAQVRADIDQGNAAERWSSAIWSTVNLSFSSKKFRNSMFGQAAIKARQDWGGQKTKDEASAFIESHAKGKIDPKNLLSPTAFRRLMQSCGYSDIGTDHELWALQPEPIFQE